MLCNSFPSAQDWLSMKFPGNLFLLFFCPPHRTPMPGNKHPATLAISMQYVKLSNWVVKNASNPADGFLNPNIQVFGNI